MFEYEEEIELFAGALQEFIDRYELPEKWFQAPDHIAIKCADTLDYVFRLEELMPDASQASETVLDKRRLAALRLTSELKIGELGSVSWLEVMEPRPEKAGDDVVGLEHMEFCYPDFDEITEYLTRQNVAFKLESNPGHAWVSIAINQTGQELKLNNKLLSDTIAEELANGSARLLG